ncbi:type II secretion system F family protein [Bacillus ginsengihumi]|uniref:Type II secretion system F family protein n=1 Tax=Heyndrickxia ginsengihumi TaxID=363870 RepID=A0A0A6VH31_9BACI|nr:type II secretion system F family protein [Heyndrickxia ginsengihumi]KHD86886.1 type II secretion system protein F [Heyndrickxia ginsengihumi]MBE6183855.1 type II secretion system F family protein [Bacillus sp. (in: firmicutes)]NEY20421.1 type II secretion system F family protein [Heyndrickxia ginsengihumi]
MPRFKYQGRDKSGKKNGTITASSKREALMKLREQGIRVAQMDELPETLMTKEITFGSRVKLQDFVIFLRQFSTLLKAGVTVVDSTRILASQTSSKTLKKVLLEVEEDLRAGNALSAVTAKHKKIFTPMFVNMVRAGEAGGNLDDTLERLATYYEKQHRTHQKVRSALTYPAFVAIMAIVVVIFLLVKIVPTFVSMLDSFNTKLPAITRFVLSASSFMQTYWWLVVLVFIGLYVLLIMVRKNKTSKYYLDYVLLKMPIFGKLVQKSIIARMTRTLSSLFSSSVPILQALSIVEKIVENEIMAKVIRESRDALERGQSMTEPMRRHWVFPPLVTQMIAIGEETGALDGMLAKVADFYEAEVEAATDQLKSLIEPFLIVFLAGIVGTIVASIMVPMFDIYNNVQ